MKFNFKSLLMIAFLMQGCATVRTEFTSSKESSPPLKIEKIFVVTSTDERALANQRYVGFVNGLKEGFSSCGVSSEIYKVDPMKIDNNKEIEENLKQFSADSKMLIKFETASLWRNQGGTTGDTFYFIGISSIDNKPIWKAKMKYFLQDTMFSDRTGAGRNLGLNIIDQMKKDQLLVNCREIKR